jgi:flavin-dependent dehydrogenase
LVDSARHLGVNVVAERLNTLSATSNAIIANDRYKTRFVVAADGANSRVRRIMALEGAPDQHLVFAVRGYMRSNATALELHWEKGHQPNYSWVFPLGDGYANVGYGQRNDAPGTKRALWEAAADATGIEAQDPSLRAHHLPLSSARLCRSAGRVLFVGDAAGLINPLTGEGIYYALASGRMAGQAAATSQDPPADYERAMQREFRAHFRTTALIHRVQQSPRNLEAMLVAASRSPREFDDLMNIAIGDGVLHARVVSSVVRARLGLMHT